MPSNPSTERAWPAEGVTRVPYWIYQDQDIYAREQERIFRGATWNFLGLDAELPQPGDFKTTFVGELPVIVTRGEDGEVHAFENRCAHRGALICIRDRGRTRDFACVYHNWTYDHAGNLTHVAFRNGIGGKGGMNADAKPETQAPKKLRVFAFSGLIFGTLSEKAPAFEDYVGPEVLARLKRVLVKPLRVLGSYTPGAQSRL